MKLFIREFVVRFIFTILRIVFLNEIISQVYLRVKIINVKLIGGCSNVSFVVPICFHNPKKICNQHVMSYIEFSVIIKKGSIYVHLNYKCIFSLILLFLLFLWVCQIFLVFCCIQSLLHYRIKLIDFVNYSDSFSLVRVLSRFDNPNISCFSFHSITFLYLFLFFFNDFISSFMIF